MPTLSTAGSVSSTFGCLKEQTPCVSVTGLFLLILSQEFIHESHGRTPPLTHVQATFLLSTCLFVALFPPALGVVLGGHGSSCGPSQVASQNPFLVVPPRSAGILLASCSPSQNSSGAVPPAVQDVPDSSKRLYFFFFVSVLSVLLF